MSLHETAPPAQIRVPEVVLRRRTQVSAPGVFERAPPQTCAAVEGPFRTHSTEQGFTFTDGL